MENAQNTLRMKQVVKAIVEETVCLKMLKSWTIYKISFFFTDAKEAIGIIKKKKDTNI